MPTREEVTAKVFQEVAKAFGIEESSIRMDTNFLEELDAKSTNYFPIMMALEDEYDIEFQYQEVRSKCKTVQGMIDHVMELI